MPAARLVTSEMPSTSAPASRAAMASSVGGHADQVAADRPDHADLGRRLVVRAGELDVDALLQGGVDLLAQRAQPRRVQVGEVDEVGADDRRGRRQVDVVADQHRLAGAHARAQAAAAVGQHDGLAAGGDGGTDAVRDGGDAAALVEVGAAEEDQGALVADPVRADLAAVARDGRRREAGQLGDRELVLGGAERVGGRNPAGAHHQGDVVGLGAGQLAQAGGGGVGGGVRVARMSSGSKQMRSRGRG